MLEDEESEMNRKESEKCSPYFNFENMRNRN